MKVQCKISMDLVTGNWEMTFHKLPGRTPGESESDEIDYTACREMMKKILLDLDKKIESTGIEGDDQTTKMYN